MAEGRKRARRNATQLKDGDVTHNTALIELCWDGVRYEITLVRNREVKDGVCAENTALDAAPLGWNRALSDVENGTNYSTRVYACHDLLDDNIALWAKPGKWEYPSWVKHPLYFQGAPRKKQVRTVGGQLVAIDDDVQSCYSTEPVANVYPTLRVFRPDELTLQAVVARHIFKVKSGGTTMILKQIYHYHQGQSFEQEIATLGDLEPHPSIVGLCGVVGPKKGWIDGILFSFLPGRTLNNVTSATKAHAEQWKEQVTSAMDYLHKQSKVWGDAKTSNIMVTDDGQRAVLFDFDGATTKGYVSKEQRMTVAGDLQGRAVIFDDIDKLPAEEPGESVATDGAA